MKNLEEWYEEEFDLDNMYNMDADENYATADTSIWYNWPSKPVDTVWVTKRKPKPREA